MEDMRIGEPHGIELITVGMREELQPEMVYQLSIETNQILTNSQVTNVVGRLKQWLITPFYIESKGNMLVMQFQAPYVQQLGVKGMQSLQLETIIGALPAIFQVIGIGLVGAALYTVIATVPKWVYIAVAAGLGLILIGPIVHRIVNPRRMYGESRLSATARELQSGVPQQVERARKQIRKVTSKI